jgi:hypothetical protein
MTKKAPPKAATPAVPAVDVKEASFDQLLSRFNGSGCDTESFSLATWMFSRFPEESQKLLPVGLGERLDFNQDSQTTGHEWASALLAAKKVKGTAGTELPTENIDEVVQKAGKIYEEARPKTTPNLTAGKGGEENSCRAL